MANNFTLNGQATFDLPIDDLAEQATIPVIELDIESGSDVQFVALQGGRRTVRVDWAALSGSLVHITEVPGAQADPGTPTSLAVAPNAVYTYILDPEGMDSGWGKTPRYTGNWEDLDGTVRFVPMHKEIEATDGEKEVARRNIGVLTGTFSVPGLLSPSEQYFTLDGAVFSPKAATASSYGVVQIYNGGDDHGEYGLHAVTKTYVDGRIDTLLDNLDQNLPTTGRGVKGIVAIKDETDPSITLESDGTISVHKVSDYEVRNNGGDPVRGLVRVAGVNPSDYDPATQDTWAAPVALVDNMISEAIPDILATDTEAGTVALSDTIVRVSPSTVPGAITVKDAEWDGKSCQKGIVRLQNTMSLLDDEEHVSQWSHEDDNMDPVATTPSAVRQYVYSYFQRKVGEGAIVPVATRDRLGIVKGSDSVLISTDVRTEGQMTVPKATAAGFGIVKISKAASETQDSDPVVPTVVKTEALISSQISTIITSGYDGSDTIHPVTGSAVAQAFDTETAGLTRYGTVRISSSSVDDTVTLLPIRMISDPDDPRDGRIYAEYTAEEPIEVAPATRDRYGTVKLGLNTMVDPGDSDSPLFPVTVDSEGHMYAVADASLVSFPVASLDRTGVVKAADVQLVFSSMPQSAKVTVVAEEGQHKGEMYVKAATASENGTVRLQAAMGGWQAGSYDASGYIYLTESLFRPVLEDNFMAGVGTPGLVKGVEFDLTADTSTYNLEISCPVGYDDGGHLVADVGDMPAAAYNTAGLVKLGSSVPLSGPGVPTVTSSPVRVDSEGHMGVSVADIRSKMTLNFLTNNVAPGTAGSYAIGNIQVTDTQCSVFGYDAQVSGSGNVAIGYTASATGGNTVLAGAGASIYGSGSVAVGSGAEAATPGALAEGLSVAVGFEAKANSRYSVAVGAGTEVGADDDSNASFSTAVGYYARAYGEDSTALGRNALATSYSVAVGSRPVIEGMEDWEPSQYTVSAGYSAIADGVGAIAIGASSMAGPSGVVVGYNSAASGSNSVAVGTALDVAGSNSVLIGRQATLVSDNVIKIGTGKSFAYVIMVDPVVGEEGDMAKPYLAFTKEVVGESVTDRSLQGKAVSMADLFTKLEEIGCTIYNVTDIDGEVTVIPPNADADS